MDIDFVAIISRFAHLFAASVLVGGTFYLRAVVAGPVVAGGNSPGDAETYFGSSRKTWSLAVMICTVALLGSGVYNLIVKIQTYELPSAYHMVFGVKFLLGLVVFFAAALVAGKTTAADKARASIMTWLNVAIFCAAVLFVLAGFLRLMPLTEKPSDPVEQSCARPATCCVYPG